MVELDSGVEAVAGIGPRRAALLRAAGILTVEDLLLHLPIRYEDRSRVGRVVDLAPGISGAVLGRLESVRRAGPPRRRRAEAVLRDPTGVLDVVWFHQGYLADSLPVDRDVVLWGTPDRGRDRLRMANPVHALAEDLDDSPHVGRPVPIHRRIGDLGPAALRRLIDTALEALERVPEDLPDAVVAKAGLISRREALRQVHYPPPDADLPRWDARRSPAHRRLAIQELVAFQAALILQRRRAESEAGTAHELSRARLAEVLAGLPFALTGAQTRALEEVTADLRSRRPMHRLLQGDVGSGKTAVAGAAALALVREGGQAALLAPTDMLARQHARTLGEWGRRIGAEVAVLTGATPAAPRREVLDAAESGRPLMVVGTHALLEDDVRFRSLDLVVIDEQHRFGVAQRAALRARGRSGREAPADLLVTTATPIPRSLALALYGDLDVSVIDELPPGRTPVVTRLRTPAEWVAMADEIESRMRRGERTYVVSPRIHEGEDGLLAATELAAALGRRFGVESVGLVHGELPSDERDAAMERFATGAVPVLVATTVIEVGVDVPEATLMVIDHAERFGLAQLHQLRGRVGRGRRASECWLIGHGELGAPARGRLETLCSTQDGFRIAEEDLRLRGPGEILGSRQTGPLELRACDPFADSDWLLEAHALARGLADGEDADSRTYRETLRRTWRRRMRLMRAG